MSDRVDSGTKLVVLMSRIHFWNICGDWVKFGEKFFWGQLFHKVADFFVKDTATTEIYTLALHDALPILLEPKEMEVNLFF